MLYFFRSAVVVIVVVVGLVPVVEDKVCGSVDVRNTPEQISDFRDCRVIKGHLQVVLMENSEDSCAFLKNSFAKLYEITDYLMVFRVMKLSSLDVIFPNLTVIGGKNLFLNNYSLVLYDLPDLEEIGLRRLKQVKSGNVFIGNCHNLCYVKTVNWKALGGVTVVQHNQTECCSERCPGCCRGYCWNNYQCQDLRKIDDCSDLCIGCTKSNSTTHCHECKYFNNSGVCVEFCPSDKLTDNTAGRCIKTSECVSKNFSVYHNSCVAECPDWYKRNSTGNCNFFPTKSCVGMVIHNLFDLDQMTGCTDVKGSLVIALKEHVNTQFLEIGLGRVQTIFGYLKVSGCCSPTTLTFFRNLTRIQGNNLWNGYYSLVVNENQNLQQLFGNNSRVVIDKGEALVQNNPNLCPSHIHNITTSTKSWYNGLETTCNFTELEVKMIERNSTNVTMSWSEDNNTRVLYYSVCYVRMEDHFTVHDGFVENDGSAIDDGWNSITVFNNTVFLKRLIPYTRYAYYIKTTTTERNQIRQTPIYQFRTATGDPSEPVDLKFESRTENTVTLKWKPPSYFNGKLSHYELAVYLQEDDQTLLEERNYCFHPLKENNSSKTDHWLFLQDEVCINSATGNCNKTYYSIENNMRIKRSDVPETVREYLINSTVESFLVGNLRPYTLYTFFLKACNEKDGTETHRCGGSAMEFNRTEMKVGADTVTDVTITTVNDVIVTWSRPSDPNSMILVYKIEYERVPLPNQVTICITSDKCKTSRCIYKFSGLEAGRYRLRVRAVTLAGSGEVSSWTSFEFGEVGFSSGGMDWVYALLGIFGTIIVVLLASHIWRYNKSTIDIDRLVGRLQIEDEDEWKLDEETVEIVRELEENTVGVIYRNN